jgi:hypothetical protein
MALGMGYSEADVECSQYLMMIGKGGQISINSLTGVLSVQTM